MSHAKGSRYERELVNRFRENDWGALRLPSSGSATDADLPDVLAGEKCDWRDWLDPISDELNRNRSHKSVTDAAAAIGRQSNLLAVELKSGQATTLYVDSEEVAALERFAERWGATPLLGARYTTQGSGTGTYLVKAEDARETDGGNYGLPKAEIIGRASWAVTEEDVWQ